LDSVSEVIELSRELDIGISRRQLTTITILDAHLLPGIAGRRIHDEGSAGTAKLVPAES
jgi:hypothetical protein